MDFEPKETRKLWEFPRIPCHMEANKIKEYLIKMSESSAFLLNKIFRKNFLLKFQIVYIKKKIFKKKKKTSENIDDDRLKNKEKNKY